MDSLHESVEEIAVVDFADGPGEGVEAGEDWLRGLIFRKWMVIRFRVSRWLMVL